MTFATVINAIAEGSFGETCPTAAFLNPTDWNELYEQMEGYSRNTQRDEVSRAGFAHILIGDTPVMKSPNTTIGWVVISCATQPYDGRFNFSYS